MQFIVTILTFD